MGSALAIVAAQAVLVTCALSPIAAFAAEPPVAGTLDLRRTAGPARGTDMRLLGQLRDGRAGSAVAFVGDLDGDGHQDYAVGSPYARTRRGEVAVVYGPPGASVGLGSALGNRGFRVSGPHPGAYAGTSVAGLGDVNGDGRDDMLVGVPRLRFTQRGASGGAYVVLGSPRRSGRISLASLGSGGVLIMGAASGDATGTRVTTIDDLDGDARKELVIGAPSAATLGRPDAGAVFVVYSRALGATVDLGLLAGKGYRIDGAAAGDDAGYSVASVADMSGDGRPEVVLGAPSGAGLAGAAYVVWGRDPQAAAPVDLAALGAQGLVLTGQGTERAGETVAGLADATQDGTPDIAVGAPSAAPYGRVRAGTVYVVSGRAGPGVSALGEAPLRVHGGDPGEALGRAVAPAGDVDADGVADVLVGLGGERALARAGAGAVLVVLTGRATRPDLDTALLGYAGVRLAGPSIGAAAGRAVAGGVDLNGDRRPDVLAGLPGERRRGGAAAAVLLPAPQQTPATPARTGGAVATNVEAIVEDSRSMRGDDPGGLLRRQALELAITNPANQGRVFGAVEFDSAAHQVLPPIPAGDASLQGDRLSVLRLLLRERITSTGARSGAVLGFGAAAAQNPGAQARILFTGGALGDLSTVGDKPTYVIGLRVSSATGRRQLEAFATGTGGRFYPVTRAGELQAALAEIETLLRGETALAAKVEDTPGVTPVPATATGEAAAAVTQPGVTLAVRSTLPAAKARRVRRLRLVVTWDRRDTRFRPRVLRLRLRGGRTVKVGRKKLRRALRGRSQQIGAGLKIRGHAGKTFLTLDVRGLTPTRGRRATASVVFGARAVIRLRRTRGSRRAITRSRWTYQRRPG